MLGIAHSSISIIELLIDRTKFFICPIEKSRPPKNEDPGYNPSAIFEKFLKEKSGGRIRVALVHGYVTLSKLRSDPQVKYVVFDAPQILAKSEITILDASQKADGTGTWEVYKKTPKEINSKLHSIEGGYTLKIPPPKFVVRDILTSVCKGLDHSEKFKVLVARYIFGMVSTEKWNSKIELLKDMVSKEKFELLISWLDSFAPDALCLAYQDCLYHATKRCEKYYREATEGKVSEIVKKKFEAIAKKACSNSDADYEDFMFLVGILPPSSEYLQKFIVAIPPYLVKHRKIYPLIKLKDAKEPLKMVKNT